MEDLRPSSRGRDRLTAVLRNPYSFTSLDEPDAVPCVQRTR